MFPTHWSSCQMSCPYSTHTSIGRSHDRFIAPSLDRSIARLLDRWIVRSLERFSSSFYPFCFVVLLALLAFLLLLSRVLSFCSYTFCTAQATGEATQLFWIYAFHGTSGFAFSGLFVCLFCSAACSRPSSRLPPFLCVLTSVLCMCI